MRIFYLLKVMMVLGWYAAFWLPAGRRIATRGKRLSAALQTLGPSFIKLGQALSLRADVVGDDIADALTELQDSLPPFPFMQAKRTIETEFKRPLTELFQQFDETPVAAASIAQVHFAVDAQGRNVAVKILRPNVEKRFQRDIALFRTLANMAHCLFPHYRRLKLPEVVEQFARTARVEMDLRLEAAAASQLRENMHADEGIYVPEIYWDTTSQRVLTLERIKGIRIDDIPALKQAGFDPKHLIKNAAEIFFKQVYRDGFFHADMHPGNLFIDVQGRIALVDFGIMGRLSYETRIHLAQLLIGFLQRDYDEVSRVHFAAGWIPENQDQELFAQAARSIGEPIFGKPQNEISIARLLQQLFKITEDFQMETQPQLLLLQKTMMLAEGLGRVLYPHTNFWELARPLTEAWAKEHLGVKARVRAKLNKLPTLLEKLEYALDKVVNEQTSTSKSDNENSSRYFWKIAVISAIVSAVTTVAFGFFAR